MKVGHPSIGYLNGFSFATPTAAPESEQPTSLSWPLALHALASQAPHSEAHTSDTTSTNRLWPVCDWRSCHPAAAHRQGCAYTCRDRGSGAWLPPEAEVSDGVLGLLAERLTFLRAVDAVEVDTW